MPLRTAGHIQTCQTQIAFVSTKKWGLFVFYEVMQGKFVFNSKTGFPSVTQPSADLFRFGRCVETERGRERQRDREKEGPNTLQHRRSNLLSRPNIAHFFGFVTSIYLQAETRFVRTTKSNFNRWKYFSHRSRNGLVTPISRHVRQSRPPSRSEENVRYLFDCRFGTALNPRPEHDANKPNNAEQESDPVDGHQRQTERVQKGHRRGALIAFTIHRDCPRSEYPSARTRYFCNQEPVDLW